MADYGFRLNDSNGLRLFDTRLRSWEVIAWGVMPLVANVPYTLSIPSNIDMPMVFVNYVGGTGFLVRGRRAQADRYETFISSTTRNVPYAIAGFRNDGDAGGGYGLAVFDAAGRCGFSTSRAYLRPNFPATLFTAYNWTNDVQSTWRLDGFGDARPAVWTVNSYLWWRPPWTWDDGGSNKWAMGVAYGYFPPGGFDALSLQRISYPNTYYNAPYQVGGLSAGGTGPGVSNQFPQSLLATEFFPPS